MKSFKSFSIVAISTLAASQFGNAENPANCDDVCSLVPLTFGQEQLEVDNFFGIGSVFGDQPANAPEEIRYGNVGTYEGRALDMKITSTEGYTPDCGKNSESDACRAQDAQYYGGIGVKRGSERSMHNTFTLVYRDTDEPAVVPYFCFSFVDIGRGNGPIEYVTIGGYGDGGIFNHYALGAELRVEDSNLDGKPAKMFRAGTNTGMPNPENTKPTELNKEQYDASFQVIFQNTASFDLVFGTLYDKGCCQRMWFAGETNVPGGTCPIVDPVMPTGSPTKSSTHSPTVSPTESASNSPTNNKSASPTKAPSISPTKAPSISPTKAPSGGGSYGDPHLKTWTGRVYDFHGECDLLLAKSPAFGNGLGFEAQIRTTIRDDWSFISTVAIKMGEDVFEVRSGGIHLLNGVEDANLKTTNLAGFQVKKHGGKKANGTVKARYVINMKEQGKLELKVYNEFVSVMVSDVRSEDFHDSVGLMGSFEDGKLVGRDLSTVFQDVNEFGFEWQVRDTDLMLFNEARYPQFPAACTMPNTPSSNQRRLSEAAAVAGMIPLSVAEKACEHLPEEDLDACIYDVISTGDLEMAEADEFDEEDDDATGRVLRLRGALI